MLRLSLKLHQLDQIVIGGLATDWLKLLPVLQSILVEKSLHSTGKIFSYFNIFSYKMGEIFSYPSVYDGALCDNIYQHVAVRYCPGELSLGYGWGFSFCP